MIFSVTAEPGVRLSILSGILETVAMTLQLTGPVPDLSLVDAIAIGLTGTRKNYTLLDSIFLIIENPILSLYTKFG